MKVWQGGLLVAGAALAGALAVRMTDIPNAPVAAAPAVHVQPPPVQMSEPTPSGASIPKPAPVVSAPVPVEVASAPPPIYSEPTHYVKPSPAPVVKVVKTPVPEPRAAVPAPPPYREPVKMAEVAKPAPEPVHVDPPHQEQPPDPPLRHATLASGATVSVRLTQPLSGDRVALSDVFQGVLARPLVADGMVVGELGAIVTGRVVDVRRGEMTLRLLNFQSADGQRVEISTEPWVAKRVGPEGVVNFRLAARITITERRL
jgi:hypothetical protein